METSLLLPYFSKTSLECDNDENKLFCGLYVSLTILLYGSFEYYWSYLLLADPNSPSRFYPGQSVLCIPTLNLSYGSYVLKVALMDLSWSHRIQRYFLWILSYQFAPMWPILAYLLVSARSRSYQSPIIRYYKIQYGTISSFYLTVKVREDIKW